MDRIAPRELGLGRLMIDLGFRDVEGLVASYVLPQEDGFTLVETGPTTCADRLMEGVRAAGVDPSEVKRVLVTHIHLDHAGGLGRAAEMFPNAQLFAHRLGTAHLVDPSKLIESARRAWGASSDRLWGPIPPVPAGRLVALSGGERLAVTGGELVVIETPGHARHHLAFLDLATGAMMTGDAAGVRLERSGRTRPAIPPPDLDLDLLFGSLEKMAAAGPKAIWLSHFGPDDAGPSDLADYRLAVEAWRDVALEAAREEASVNRIVRALRSYEESRAARLGVPGPASEQGDLVSGYDLAAQGLLRYFRTHGILPG
ncbi:MAG: MBL fold metallo-hydrolase [Thermoplasmata archaeon]|nr:MBL fold metallo-hydrolase [Thermoplasmata archaeon]